MSEAQSASMKPCKMKHHDSRDLVLRDDIMQKAKQLAEMLATTDEVVTYQKAEKLVQENDRIQQLISAIKKKQKEIVAFEQFENQQMVNKIENEIQELQDELDSIPLVQQFQQTQSDINYMLQLIISVIRDTLSEKIAVETGATAPPTSCSE